MTRQNINRKSFYKFLFNSFAIYIFINVFLLFSNSLSQYQPKAPVRYKIPDNILSNRDILIVEGLITTGYTDYNSNPGAGIKTTYEHYFTEFNSNVFGFNIEISGLNIFGNDLRKNPDGFKTNLVSLGPNVIYSYGFSQYLLSYFTAGISAIWFNPMVEGGAKSPNNELSKYNNFSICYNFGGGLKIPLSNVIYLNIGASLHYVPNDNLDDLTVGKFNDYYLAGSAGISISLFNRTKPLKTTIPGNDNKRFYKKPSADSSKNIIAKTPDVVDSVFTTNIKYPNTQDTSNIVKTDNNSLSTTKDSIVQSDKKVEDLEKKISELEKTVDDLKTRVKEPEKELAAENRKVAELEKKIAKTERAEIKTSETEITEKESAKEKKPPFNDVSVQMDITFSKDNTAIRPEANTIVSRIAGFLKKYPNTKWRIEAHVDEGNTSQQVVSLSLRRAQALVNYFVSRGISFSNFEIVFMGDKHPIERNTSAYGRMKNRRIDIVRVQ